MATSCSTYSSISSGWSYAAELSDQINLHDALADSLPAATDTGQGGLASERSSAELPQRWPELLTNYQLECEFGRGGMGVVYRARHMRLNRLVALKMVRAAETATAELLDRFRAKAEAVAPITGCF